MLRSPHSCSRVSRRSRCGAECSQQLHACGTRHDPEMAATCIGGTAAWCGRWQGACWQQPTHTAPLLPASSLQQPWWRGVSRRGGARRCTRIRRTHVHTIAFTCAIFVSFVIGGLGCSSGNTLCVDRAVSFRFAVCWLRRVAVASPKNHFTDLATSFGEWEGCNCCRSGCACSSRGEAVLHALLASACNSSNQSMHVSIITDISHAACSPGDRQVAHAAGAGGGLARAARMASHQR